MLIRTPQPWSIREREATPQGVFDDRRAFLQKLGLAAIGTAMAPAKRVARIATADLYPAKRNEVYKLDVPLTPESIASRHNIFDEFTLQRDRVWKVAENFASRPWKIHVGGAVEKALQFDVDELVRKLGAHLEERLYRFRCIEAWAMAVPWTGIPFRRFVELVKPTASAKYVRMVTAARPDEMPGWYASRRVFPYYEALSLAEANNDLALLATGIYGKPLPNQHGAPLRLIVPWKYGLKGIKSIVAFEFTRERPGTFWNELSPSNYSFEANVDPTAPGQSEEIVLGTGETRKTRPYNGYGEMVASLYS
jgi:methionine sulfoxide reductase catalytic subunit